MPTFRIETTQGTFEVEANQAPTESDVQALVAQMGGSTPQKATNASNAPETAPVGFLERIANALGSNKADRDRRAQIMEQQGPSLSPGSPNSPVAARAAGGSLVRAALPAAGVAAGPYAPVAVPALAAAGEYLGGKVDGEGTTPGRMAGAVVASAIPGNGGLVRNLVAQPAANLAGKAVETVVDEKRLPNAGEVGGAVTGGVVGAGLGSIGGQTPGAVTDTVKNQNIRNFIAEGGRVVPSQVEPTMANRLKDMLGNRANVAREAAVTNSAVTTRLAKEEIGIPANQEITQAAINDRLEAVSQQYYEPVAAVSPQAAVAVQKYRYARTALRNANDVWSDPSNHTELNQRALVDAETAVKDAEHAIARTAGNDGLASIKEGAKKWAQINDVWDATNKGTAEVDPAKIGRTYNETEKLSGNLEKIGAFNKAAGTNVSKEASNIPSPMMGRLFTGIGAGSGYAAGGVPGAVAGAVAPLALEEGMRRWQLSNRVQNSLALPKVKPSREDLGQAMARFAAMQQGRK